MAQRMYVVSVGICYYKYINGLRKTENDARSMAELYKTHTKDVSLLLGKDATHDKILSTLRSVFSHATDNDIVVFFFSGHGSKGGLCAYDTRKDNLVTYKEIQQVLKSCRANNKQLFIDACFSGGLRTQSSQVANNIFTDSNVMLFLSSRTNETSRENPWGKNGYYTQFLVKGIKGAADADKDRIITAKEIFDYVSSNVTTSTANHQHPVMWGKFSNDLHIMNWNKK